MQTKQTCKRCAGSGKFVTRVVNGKPVGPGGECYRCGGKGYQTRDDERRNASYDRYEFQEACRGMMADR